MPLFVVCRSSFVRRRHNRDERRAVAQQAGIIFVARRLVDLCLTAELGLDRLDAQAVRFGTAIAAALTDRLVDEYARRWVGRFTALAQAAQLGGAGLVVDQHRDTRRRLQHAL